MPWNSGACQLTLQVANSTGNSESFVAVTKGKEAARAAVPSQPPDCMAGGRWVPRPVVVSPDPLPSGGQPSGAAGVGREYSTLFWSSHVWPYKLHLPSVYVLRVDL